MDSRVLIKKTLAGNKKAFESIIEGHQRLVSHIVFRMIQNTSDQEDICQDAFLKVYQNLGGFQFESKLSTWIAKIAYNTCLNYLEKKRVPLFDDLTSEEKTIETVSDCSYRPDQVVEGRETSSLLRTEIENMPVHYRTILTLYHLDQMSYRELQDYIGQIEKRGFETLKFKVDLNFKLTFPLASFIMALLGIPFAFSMGKRGTLVGIGLGVIIAMVYWGTIATFRSLGYVNYLSPFLAAWGPSLIFGAVGLYLISTLKT